MTNTLISDYKIIHEKNGYFVYKIDTDGKPIERKNSEPYPSRKAALPYMRKLYSVMPKTEAAETDAPNYRETELGNKCEVCQHITGLECTLYKFIPEPTNTCDSFEFQTGMDMEANLILGAVTFTADEDDPQILRFKDAVLARPETNKNQDTVDIKGIEELANSIAGRPIDLDHDTQKNVGVFTAGRVGKDGELLVDGMIWTDRCAAFGVTAEDVVRRGLSIEANATTAECSKCGKVYTDAADYCEHINSVRSKLKHAAQRVLKGLRAVGGALTPKPAASSTGFGTASIVFLASHEMIEEEDMANTDNTSQPNSTLVVLADSVVAEIDKEVRAAWSYIHMPKNASKYSPEEVKTIENNIKRAGKKYGIEFSEQEINMSDEVDDKKVDSPAEEKKESDAEKKAELEAAKGKADEMMMKKKEMDDMKAAIADMTAKLEAAQKERDDFKAKYEAEVKASKTTLLKSKLVGSVLDEEEFSKNVEMLLTLPSEAVELMLKGAKKPVSESMRINAAEIGVADEPRKLY